MFHLDTNEKKWKNLDEIWKSVVGHLSLQYIALILYFHHINISSTSSTSTISPNSESEGVKFGSGAYFFSFFFLSIFHHLSKGGVCLSGVSCINKSYRALHHLFLYTALKLTIYKKRF